MSVSKPITSVELLAAIRTGPNGDMYPLDETVNKQGLVSIYNTFLVVDFQLKVW